MNLKPNEFAVPGVTNRALREFLRYEMAWRGVSARIIDKHLGEGATQKLLDGAFIEEVTDVCSRIYERDEVNPTFYGKSFLGGRVAAASFLKPIPKVKADLLFQGFMERVEEVNADERFPLKVKAVHLFGSYLNEQPSYGDIDLRVETDWRGGSYAEAKRLRDVLIDELGRDLDFVGIINWPERALRQRLQKRKPGLSITLGAPDLDTEYRKVF